MKPYSRAERVGGQIQKALAEILTKKIKDPRLRMATITTVKVARDLKTARVYFATSGVEGDKEAAAEGFNSALGYVKRSLARQLGLRYMPAIQFFYDDTFEQAIHINNVLKMIDRGDEADNTTAEKE